MLRRGTCGRHPALIAGEHPPHVPPTDVLKLLIVDRDHAGQDLGGELVRHARALPVNASAALLRVDLR